MECEFCDGMFRKDRYAVHVKAKHVKELGKLFLERCNDPLFNPIKSIAKGYQAQNIPVYSKRHEYDCFYFGAKPQYFEKNDSFGSYLQNEQNMKEHCEFLKTVINHIPLTDFLAQSQIYRERLEQSRDNSDRLRLGGLTTPTLFRFETLGSQK